MMYTPTPDYYNDYIQHFNPFHDPRNGQFASKNGGSGSTDKLKKKAVKAEAKAAKANKKAAQAGSKVFHPFKAKRKDKLQIKAFKAQAKADKLNSKLNKAELKENNKKFEEEFNKILNTAKTDEEKDKRIRELDDAYVAKQQSKINQDIDKAQVKREYLSGGYEWLDLKVKDSDRQTSFHGFGDRVSEKDLKDAAKMFYKDKKSIEKQALDVITNDNSEYSIYNLYAKDRGISKDQFKKSLEIKSVYVADNDGSCNISIWEKNNIKDNLTGGHSLDIEYDLKRKKMSNYYSMNG